MASWPRAWRGNYPIFEGCGCVMLAGVTVNSVYTRSPLETAPWRLERIQPTRSGLHDDSSAVNPSFIMVGCVCVCVRFCVGDEGKKSILIYIFFIFFTEYELTFSLIYFCS